MSYVSEAQQLQADTEMKLTALYNRYSDLTALNSALLYERGEFYYQFNRPAPHRHLYMYLSCRICPQSGHMPDLMNHCSAAL